MNGAVAYLRVEEDVPESVQRRALAAWAAREGIAIEAVQVDVGIAADTPIAERPGLVAAYRAVHELGARVLVAADATRFAEDAFVAGLVERAALMCGATLHTADGSPPVRGEGAPAEASYTRGAIDLARAYERVMVGARIRAALAEKRSRGERTGNLPFGYRLDGDRVVPDEAERAIVSSVCALSSSGLSQRAIARELTARGVVGRTGAPLGQTQIANILRAARAGRGGAHLG